MPKRILTCFCLLLCTFAGLAQTSRFQEVTTRDGLPSNYIFGVNEDENGYLWIGSDKGLGRFDGFKWEVYDSDNGLPGNYIPQFVCNQRGGIWLSIPGKGTFYFDIRTSKCTFSTNASPLNGFQVNEDGDVFFCDIFKGESTVRGLMFRSSDPKTMLTVFSFEPDTKNTTIAVNFQKKLVTVFGDTLVPPGDLHFKDPLWKAVKKSTVATSSNLLRMAGNGFYYDNKKIFYSRSQKVETVFTFPFSGKYLQALQENEGMWLWNMKDGLFWLSGKSNIRQYGEKDGLASLIVNDVYRSRRGDLLVSTLGAGLLKMLRPGNARIDTYRKMVKGFAYHGNTIYAALEDRVLSFDVLKTQDVKIFPTDEKSLQGLNIDDDKLFITSLFGFSEYNIGEKHPLKTGQTKIGSGVNSVIRYNDGYAIGTYGAGIHFMDRAGRISIIPETPLVSEKLLPAQNGLYSLNYEDGVHHFQPGRSPELFSTKNGLLTNNILHVHEYKDTLWMATRRGVSAVYKGRKVKHFELGESLHGSQCIYSFHDTSGKFWVVTNRYLHEFDGRKFFRLSVFTLTEGKDDQIFAALYHPGANMLVTGSGNRISLTKLSLNVNLKPVIPPRLAGISVDGEPEGTETTVKLPADFEKVSVRFHPGLTSPFSNTGIYYKLSGLQEDFLPLTDSLTVSFSLLRSGNYSLLAKTINSNGRESDEVELATIKVLSPFWQRSWFIILCTLLLAGLSFYLYELYKRNKRTRKRKLMLMEERVSLERVRISKDLHDHLGTSLVTMIAQTENIENNLKLNNVDGALDKVRQLSDQSRNTIDVLRETIWAVQENSHSVSEFILRTRNFLQRIYLSSNIEWEVTLTGGGDCILSANQTLQLFRVIQESTQNIIKHAFATKASYVFFENENELRLEIADNGRGIHTGSEAGNGLENIKQRINQIGGVVNFHSNNGTIIFISIPLQKRKN